MQSDSTILATGTETLILAAHILTWKTLPEMAPTVRVYRVATLKEKAASHSLENKKKQQ